MSTLPIETPHLFLVSHGEPSYYSQGLSGPGRFDAHETAKKLVDNPAVIGRILILSACHKYDVETAAIIGQSLAERRSGSIVSVLQDNRLDKVEGCPGSRDRLRAVMSGLLVDHATMPDSQQPPETFVIVTDAALMAVADGKPAYSSAGYLYGGPNNITDHTGDWVAPRVVYHRPTA